MFPETSRVNFFYHSPAYIVECVSQYIFLISKDKNQTNKQTTTTTTTTTKQKQKKQTKKHQENKNTKKVKETKEEKIISLENR